MKEVINYRLLQRVKKNNHLYNGLKPNNDILGAIRRGQDERSNKL